MKIKHGIKYCVAIGAVFVAVGGAGVVWWSFRANTDSTYAYVTEEYARELNTYSELTYGQNDNDEDGSDAYYEITGSDGGGEIGYYDSRDYYNIRNKDQHSEGICGIYSMTSTLEHAIAKKYNDNIEISPKHFDYQLAKAETAYKDSGVRNAYFDRYASAHPEYSNRKLGKSSSQYLMLFGLANPLAIMSEGDFTEAIKTNDSRISSINRYEDIWGLDGHDAWLDEGRYTVKQDFSAMNNPDATEYVVTGIGLIRYPYYGPRDDRDDVIETIKNSIKMYGAVDVTAHIDVNNCAYETQVDGRNRYTLIDRGSSCVAETNHGMVIVGWDDNWEYYDGETKKTGAFILQNSWGEKEVDKMKWHLSYDSRFSGVYFDSIEKYDDYSHYYGAFDYRDQTTIEPEQDEYVYEFDVDDGNKELKEFTFNQHNDPHEYRVYLANGGESDNFVEIGTFASELGMEKYVFDDGVIVDGDFAIKLKQTDGGEISEVEREIAILNVMADDVWVLSIDNGNGDVSTRSCKVDNGSCSMVLSADIPVRDGYIFQGYASSSNSTTAEYQPGDAVRLADNKTIYAVWTNSDGSETEKQGLDNGDDESNDENDNTDNDDVAVPSTAATSGSDAPDAGVSTEQKNGGSNVAWYILPGVVVIMTFGIFMARRNKMHKRFD